MKLLKPILIVLLATSASFAQVVSKKSNSITLNLSGITPSITWMSPQTYETSLTEKMYSVKVGIKSEGKLKSADLYLNEQLVGEARGFRPASSGYDKVIERDITLQPGDNIIKKSCREFS